MAAGKSVRALATLICAASLVALFSSSAHATAPGVNGRIVFTSLSDSFSVGELYSVNADGSGLRRLTWTPQDEQSPAWSPDGTRIAYAKFSDTTGSRIWVMNADGSGQTQLTPSGSSLSDRDPTWSPDGKQLAFSSSGHLRVMNADGSGLRSVGTFFASFPDWSPDGTKLAYLLTNGIGVVGIDGSNPHLVSAGTSAQAPSWSPDGSQIVFARNNAQGLPGELYIANVDGSGERQLTADGSAHGTPSWSPDGTQIAFQRADTPSGVWHLWSIAPDGTGLHQITLRYDLQPNWGSSQLVPETSPPVDPVIGLDQPWDGGTYLQGFTTLAWYSCVSYVSLVVTCKGDIPVGGRLDQVAGTHTFTVRAVDLDGRTTTKTVTYAVLDLIPPQVSLRSPANGATHAFGSTVTIDYSCDDPNGSGVTECLGDQPNGTLLDTSRGGTNTFHVIAMDAAGNRRTATATYTVTGGPQSIVFRAIPDHVYGDSPFVLTASGGGSGNPVTFTATGQCSVSGATLSITGAGSCTVTAHQAGGNGYLPATDVTQGFTIAKAPQAVSFAPLPDRLYGDAPFTVTAIGGPSGNPLSFTADGQCTISGSTVTITDLGSCTVTAHQDGNGNYLAAPDVAQTFAINPPPGCNKTGQAHGNEHFSYGTSDVYLEANAACAPSLQNAMVRLTVGGNQVLINAGQDAVTSVTFTHTGDVVLMGSWNGTKYIINLHDGGKGGTLDTLRVRYGSLDTGILSSIHGDVLVDQS